MTDRDAILDVRRLKAILATADDNECIAFKTAGYDGNVFVRNFNAYSEEDYFVLEVEQDNEYSKRTRSEIERRLMTLYAVVDLSSLFHRCRHVTMGDTETKVGMALHLIFRSLRKMHRELCVDHFVFAIDHGSWRNAVYPAYKSRRRLERAKATTREREDDIAFYDALSALTDYLDLQTRCTVLRSSGIEGDDFVARWIIRHPSDRHIIISGDSDFVQLLAANVQIYDAINQRMITVDQITDDKNMRLAFTVSPQHGRIKVGKPDATFVPEPDWPRKALFVKLIRGDAGDSVFSAFPGVRYEGKAHSIGSAWADRHAKGYDWNNLMFQTWNKMVGVDQAGAKLTESVRVIDEYHINESLIDLTKQPDTVIEQMDRAIDEATTRPLPQGIGVQLLRFCKKHDLPFLEKEADQHIPYLNAPYKGTR